MLLFLVKLLGVLNRLSRVKEGSFISARSLKSRELLHNFQSTYKHCALQFIYFYCEVLVCTSFLFSLCCFGRLNYSDVNQYVYKYIQQDSLKTNSFGLSLKTSDFRISAVHFSFVLLKIK